MNLPRSSAYRVFWLGRYLERADGNARVVRLALAGKISWDEALASLGLADDFARRSRVTGPESVASYLVFDTDNPSSIRSTVARARENANGTVPDAVYCEINRIHLSVAETSFEAVGLANLDSFLEGLLARIQHLEEHIEEVWA